MLKTNETLFNEYTIKARLFPAFISALPLLLVKRYLIDNYFAVSLTQIIFGDISIAIILIYLFAQINRFISKLLFEVKSDFPTDQKLLPSNGSLSKEYRANLAQKIKTDFNLSLPTIDDENENEKEAKIRIREIVKSIIEMVRNGNLLFQHNIEYGFIRNLIGGSVVAFLVSIININIFWFLFPNKIPLIVSILTSIFYLIPIIFSRKILNHYSEEYSQVLFREYLGRK